MVAEPPFSNSFRFPLSIPGEVAVPGWALSAAWVDDPGEVKTPAARGDTAVVAAGPLQGPLAVRTRRRGDTFKPSGMGGRGGKLQDFWDRRCQGDRDSRRPWWMARPDRMRVGQSVAEDFRVTAPKHGVILLKARRLGGVG